MILHIGQIALGVALIVAMFAIAFGEDFLFAIGVVLASLLFGAAFVGALALIYAGIEAL